MNRIVNGDVKARPPRDVTTGGIIAAFIAVSFVFAWLQGFHQFHNDFWDVYHAALRLAWSDRTTWYNGQYPIANVLTVRACLAVGAPVAVAMTLNILFAGVTLRILAGLCRGLISPVWVGFSVLGLAAFPEFFRYANAGGGDPAATLLFTAGGVVAIREILDEPGRMRVGRWFLAGLLMGWGGLFRYHALVGGALWALALPVALSGRRLSGLVLLAGLCAGFAPQWIVNLLAGRGLFETGFGPMNVHHLMHGMNWQRVTDLRLQGSTLDIIAADPLLFFRRYAASLWSFKQIWVPPLLAFALAREPAHRRAFLALALWSCGYFALFSATSSGRQGLLALPLAMFALGYALHALWRLRERLPGATRSFRAAFGVAFVSSCLLLLILHATRDAFWLRERGALRAESVAVETALRSQGASRADEVFTTDYDLYFPGLSGLTPRFNGGAVRLGTDWFSAAFPEFPAEDLSAFAAACRARGVHYVVLDAAALDLSEAVGSLYVAGGGRNGAGLNEVGFRLIAETPRHRVFRVP